MNAPGWSWREFLKTPSITVGGTHIYFPSAAPGGGSVRVTRTGARDTVSWDISRCRPGVGGLGLRWVAGSAPGAHGVSLWAGPFNLDLTWSRDRLE